MKIISFNAQAGKGTGEKSPGKRAKVIAERLAKDGAPDVVLLQEAWFRRELPQGHVFSKNDPDAKPQMVVQTDGPHAIADALGLPFVAAARLCPSTEQPGEWAGVSILSRYPISRQKLVILPPVVGTSINGKLRDADGLRADGKGVVIAQLKAGDTKLTVASAHLHHLGAYGLGAKHLSLKPAWAALDELISKQVERGAFALGADFNIDVDLLPQLLRESFASGGIQQAGFNQFRPTRSGKKSTDELLISSDITVSDVTVLKSKVSDHRICKARLEVGITQETGRPGASLSQA